MIAIRCFPERIGVQVGDGGNPEIVGVDANGLIVTIECTSEGWRSFLSACSRLRGVGIVPAGRVQPVVVDGNGP